MNDLSDSELLELHALGNAMVDGVVTDVERLRLEQILTQSPAALREYVRLMALSASLHDYAGEMQADAPSRPSIQARNFKPWLISSGVLTVVLAAALVAWNRNASRETFQITSIHSNQETAGLPESDEPVARLSALKNCAWSGAAPVQAGDEILPDQILKLQSGWAEITFDSGARIVIEGPAALTVRSAWEAELHQGSLKAQVPHEAIGFRVLHDAVDVVDLGTEFTMSADENGGAEVLVLKGAVEAESRQTPTQKVLLNEKQGRRFAKSGMSELHHTDQKLAKWSRKLALDRPDEPLSFFRWPVEHNPGRLMQSSQTGMVPASVSLQWSHAPGPSSPATIPTAGDRMQDASVLDGHMSSNARLPTFTSKSPRSVAFWMQVPLESSPREATPAVAWTSTDASTHTEFGWNSNPAQGPYGALRINTSRSYLVGSTPLRDGQWHHVAVVFGHSHHADRLTVTLYLDGRLERMASKHALKRAARDILVKNGDLWLGRTANTPSDSSGFRGAVEGLVITNRALAPEEVRLLMRENRLGGPNSEVF